MTWYEAVGAWVGVVTVLVGGPLGITAASSWWQNRQDAIVRGPYSSLNSNPRKRLGFPGRRK